MTHVYPDGPAPYFTVLAPARRGDELAQWEAMKRAASDAIIAAGGTITHHHAVGRDHRDWYDEQRPDLFAAALRAAKSAVDPGGVLNPGVLVDAMSRAVRARLRLRRLGGRARATAYAEVSRAAITELVAARVRASSTAAARSGSWACWPTRRWRPAARSPA